MNVEALRARIVEAHEEVRRGSAGAPERLAALQDEFRRSGIEIDRPGGSMRVVEAGSVLAIGSSRTETIERIVDPISSGRGRSTGKAGDDALDGFAALLATTTRALEVDVMASKLSRKPANPFQDLPTVTASKTFVGEEVVIHRGEKRAGNDPVVAKHHGAFLAGDLQPHELPNMWNDLRDPPEHPPHVYIPPSIAPHRQVRSTVSVWFDGGFAPGSPGAKSGRPSGYGTAIRIGQIFDVLTPIVRQHPEWFVWVERQVSLADIERIERLEDIPES